jgi:outer membrane protein TolC
VEPEIQAQLIGFVQEAGYAYWNWVAAGGEYAVYRRILSLAEDRTERIREQVESGLIDPPELTDNQRLVADRRAKLADASRKLQQKAVKLSLFYRDAAGEPLIPAPEQLPEFPEPAPIDPAQLDSDSRIALQARPEIKVLDLIRRQLEVDFAQAHNETRPAVNGLLWGSQDVGAPTSSKRDKSQFELEASLFAEMPLQFRKARGKLQSVQGKLAQLTAKRRLTEDKIVADVQATYAALVASYEQVVQTREAVRLAEEMAQRERENFAHGASDLLKVTLREQYAAESALKQVDALRQYYEARVDYRAALAQDQVSPPE